MDYAGCTLCRLTEETAAQIAQWEYSGIYSAYDFKGSANGYLMNRETWGDEQFCLMYEKILVGYVTCQYENTDLWIGWSLSPVYCGMGEGYRFVSKCVEEIRKAKRYTGPVYLRVAVANERAVKAYLKAGFHCLKTILDEIPYTNFQQPFWVMRMAPFLPA